MIRQLERYLLESRVLLTCLRIAKFGLALVVPYGFRGTALGWPLLGMSVVGLAIGWKWGHAESMSRNIGPKIAGILWLSAGSLAAFFGLLSISPSLGVVVPTIFESTTIYWSMIWIKALSWGLFLFALMRLYVILSRRASKSHR